MIAANENMVVAQIPTTIALMANGLKAAIGTVAMRTKEKDIQGKIDGVSPVAADTPAVNTVTAADPVVANTAAVSMAAVSMAAVSTVVALSRDREVNTAVVKAIVPALKMTGITPMTAKADTAASSAATTQVVTTTAAARTTGAVHHHHVTTIRVATAPVKTTVNAVAAMTTTMIVAAKNVAG